jgi:outer membrane lipoprotein-sorting protein
MRYAQLFFLFVVLPAFAALGEELPEWRALLDGMEKTYATVTDYRAEVEVRTYGSEGSFETDRFLYTFKKPKSIRLDWESPHKGMILVCPDKKGKVAIRPPGFAHFMKLHLAPDNPLIRVSSGQPIDKTDMGLLIEHIAHSLADERRGPIEVWNEAGNAEIRVLGLNHFRNEVLTLYEFSVDTRLGLPVGVKETSPEGKPQRIVTFRNLEINKNVPDSLFTLDEEKGTAKEEKDEK